MKNKINTIIKNALEKGVTINFKEENIIDHIWNDNVVGSIEYKGFKGMIYLCDVSAKDAGFDSTWIQLRLYKPNGEEVPSNSDIVLDYCNFLKPFEHYKDFAEFVDELIENMD